MTGSRTVLLALLAGLVAAGLPAAWVVVQGGPALAAALVALLGLLPPVLAVLSRPR